MNIDSAERLRRSSRFLARELDRAGGTEWVQARQPVTPDLPEKEALHRLRRNRQRHTAHILVHDILGDWHLPQTLLALSKTAEVLISEALTYAQSQLALRHGWPRNAWGDLIPTCVIGMGKLGGGELNFCSDVDLIYVYAEGGESDGAVKLEAREYFTKLYQKVGQLLSNPTLDGVAYRVDTQLRPFGSAGALAWPLAALENYYQAHGRAWERYAWVKGRCVAGDAALGQAVVHALEPFVYRRYLDYSALQHLRELKSKIEYDALKHQPDRNLKLGTGGIRDIEFIVQAHQLIRGGDKPVLRTPSLLSALNALPDLGLIDRHTAQQLHAAYVFLRRAENAVQAYEDLQTHLLPSHEDGQAALCYALGYGHYRAFMADLKQHQAVVRQHFEPLFPATNATAHPFEMRWLSNQPLKPQDLNSVSEGTDAGRFTEVLNHLQQQPSIRRLSEDSDRTLARLIVKLLADQPSALAFERASELISTLAGRSTYLNLLLEKPEARQQLLMIANASPWLVKLLGQAPALLDQVFDSRQADSTPADWRNALSGVADDLESQMNALRQLHKQQTLLMSVRYLQDKTYALRQRLSSLAQVLVEVACGWAWRGLQSRWGEPLQGGQAVAYVVLAYGKLGSEELGLSSDLDLVFIHASADPNQATVGGERACSHSEFFAKWVQRLTALFTTQTHLGKVYDIDTELRPEGRSGLLVSGFESYFRYQHERARLWEHQALTRARVLCGDADLASAWEALREACLLKPHTALFPELKTMRLKMRSHLEKRKSGHWDVKHAAGGLIDVEFFAQYQALRHGTVQARCTQSQLAAFPHLQAVHRRYLAWFDARALQDQDGLAPLTWGEEDRHTVMTVCGWA
jgi:glutamate-ammonia-ligase adenylyltransferase